MTTGRLQRWHTTGLEWDSRQLGRRVCSVTPDVDGKEIDDIQREYDTIFARLPINDFNDIQRLERAGFYTCDISVNYRSSSAELLDMLPAVQQPYSVKPIPLSDAHRSGLVAARAFHQRPSRWSADPLIPPGFSEHLYESWASSAVSTPGRHHTLGFFHAGELAGVFVYSLTQPNGSGGEISLSLTAIDPDFQGRGLYRVLLRGVLEANPDCAEVFVGTQAGNDGIHLVWARLPRRSIEFAQVLHWHRG